MNKTLQKLINVALALLMHKPCSVTDAQIIAENVFFQATRLL